MIPTQRSLSKVPTSKLSKLQRAILQMAAENRTKGDRGSLGVDSMDCTTREILEAIGQYPSNAQRAAVSRAIARLETRGLVDHSQFFCRRSGINLTPTGWETVIKVTSGNFNNRFKVTKP